MPINWGYTPGSANAFANQFDASRQNRNLLAQQARANEVGEYQLNSLKRADAERMAVSEAYKNALDPATGAVNSEALVRNLAQGGAAHLIPDVQAKLLATQKEQGLIKETAAKTAASEADLKHKKLDWAWQGVASSPTPEHAMAYLTQSVKDGSISMQEASAEMAKLRDMAPEDYAKYRMNTLVRTLSGKDQLEAISPKIDWRVAGGQSVPIQNNPLQAGYGGQAPGVKPIVNTPTFGEKNSAADLQFRREQEAYKRAHPGFTTHATEEGLVAVSNDNPSQVVPIRVDGKSVGAKPPPAELTKIDTKLSNLTGSLKAFKDEVGKNKLTGAKGLFTGKDTANMTAKYTALLMGVKDLYELGALTGPDMGIVTDQIQNPATWAASMTSKDAVNAQIQVIEDMLRRNHINTENAYGRPLKATAAAIKKLDAAKVTAGPAPAGVDPQIWSHMTPEERSLWQTPAQ